MADGQANPNERRKPSMEERHKQTQRAQQTSGAQAESNRGPPAALLQTTRWSAERDHVGQRFREGNLNLHLQEGNIVVLESDKWAPAFTGIQSVEFNLKDSVGNILFHFNPRGWSKTIVLNSLTVRVGWGPEEIIRTFDHFKLNSPNTIAIVNNADNFEIYVNKRLMHRYQKRSSGAVARIDYRWRGADCFLSDPVTMKVHDSVAQYLV